VLCVTCFGGGGVGSDRTTDREDVMFKERDNRRHSKKSDNPKTDEVDLPRKRRGEYIDM